MIQKAAKIILLCFAITSFCAGSAEAQKASEYEVKAAFLYNFIKFVEWPATAFPDKNAPIVIGILSTGADPFYDPIISVNYLDQAIAGKTINDRKISIKRFDRVVNVKDCHLLFISKSERRRVDEILGNLKGLSILTISEVENFCQQGGMINFVMQAEKVRFEINPVAAEKAGLKVSSKLLNVAKIVPTQPR